MFGIGEFSIGGFSDSDSLSTSDPLINILSSNNRKREYLLRAALFPGTIITDDEFTLITDDGLSLIGEGSISVDISTSGYVSKSYDDPYKLFPGCISAAYSFTTELSINDYLSGGSSASGGEIKVKNVNGRFDYIATLDWLGADLLLYIGAKDYDLTQFTNFSKGVSSGVSKQHDSFSILQKDLRFRLKNPLHKHRYMGTDSCIRSKVGNLCNVNFGDILDKGANSFTVNILFKSIETALTMFLVSKRSSGAGLSYGIVNGISSIALSDGTNTSTIDDVDLSYYFDNRFHRLTIVVDRTNNDLILYVDGDDLGYRSISSIGSISNASNLVVGSKSDNSNPWIGCYDDFQIWNVALTKDQIRASMYRELRFDETNDAELDLYIPFNERDGLTVFDARDGSSITGTISNINGWVGSLEGTITEARNIKPILVGIKRNIKPILVDPFGLVYQWHDDIGEEIVDVTIAGDAFTFQAEISDIYDVVPDVDKYTVYRGSNGSYFRLGSEPTGEVLCSAKGDASLTGYASTMPTIHKRVITKWGETDTSQLDLSSYVILELSSTANVGFYFDSEIKCDEALDEIVKSGGFGWWGPNRLGIFTIGRIENPDLVVPTVNLVPSDFIEPTKGGAFSISPIGVRVRKIFLGYRRYGQTLTVDQLSTSLSQEQIKDKGSEYRFVEAGFSNNIDEDVITLYTEIDSEEDAQLEVDRMFDIWSVNRFSGRFSLKKSNLAYFIGSPFMAQVGRYELATPKKCISYGISESLGIASSADKLDIALFF